jgi:hypothetical protein
MARKYSKKASAKVERAMKKRKAGTLKSGRSGKKVTSRKQAIAIGLSEARAEGKKVPKKAAKKKTAKKSGGQIRLVTVLPYCPTGDPAIWRRWHEGEVRGAFPIGAGGHYHLRHV